MPVKQRFKIAAMPLGLASDANYVYVALFGDNQLYGYKRGSDGLILGTNYTNSVNISITLPEAVSSYLQFAQHKNQLYYSDYGNMIRAINTDTLKVEEYKPGGDKVAYVATDRYGLVYCMAYGVSSGHIYVYNFSNPNDWSVAEFSIPDLTGHKCAFDVGDNDELYVSMSSDILNVYTITRDKRNNPTGIDLSVSKNVSFPSCCCLLEMYIDKMQKLIGLGITRSSVGTDFIPVLTLDGKQTTYCTPGLTTDLQSMWTDMDYGYTLYTGDPEILIGSNTI